MITANETRLLLVLLTFSFLLWAMRRAAGRLAPRVAIAPIVFLVTRTPVLVAWGVGAIGMVAVLLPGAIAHGHDEPGDFALMAGLSAFCGLGVAALVVGPIFFVARAFTPSPTFALEPGETVLREMAANHFVGGEGRGGKLLVTTRRLGFRPHRFNVQLSTWSARLEDIRGTSVEGERFLLVETKNAKAAEWIVVWKADQVARYVRALAELSEEDRARDHEEALAAVGLAARGV